MLSKFKVFVFISLFLMCVNVCAEGEEPFGLTVEISEGKNAENWESVIFAGLAEKTETEEKTAVTEEKSAGSKKEKKKIPEKKHDISETHAVKEEEKTIAETAEKEDLPQDEEYSPASKNWGEYYGTTPRYDFHVYEKEEKKEGEKVTKVEKEPEIIKEDDSSLLSVDLVLQTQHDTEFDPMLNTGVRVNFANIYSILSVGTDYSISSQRAYSLGIAAGAFYRISDFALKAGLGYKKIWDNSEKHFNDWSLGIEAGGSYNILSWFALGAGVGVNYSVFKDSNFTDGKFVPTFFADFEFNLIK